MIEIIELEIAVIKLHSLNICNFLLEKRDFVWCLEKNIHWKRHEAIYCMLYVLHLIILYLSD